MGSEHYCLKWNNHQSNLLGVFSQLLQDESLVDVTLACAEGLSIRAHKVVLSACSSYFQTLFIDHPNRHPIVILKDVCFEELRTLVEFMYKGEVNVEYCQLSALLKTAESLKVKGLAEMTNLNMTASTATNNEKTEKVSNETVVGGQQENCMAADVSPATETVEERLKNEVNTKPSSPERISSPGPPRSKRSSRGNDCDDSSDCERDRLDVPDRTMKGGCPGPTDMSASGLALCQMPPSCSSPHVSEPFPGTSCLPPVQQVPLSLKKEVDWDNKSVAAESSFEFRHPPDSDVLDADLDDRFDAAWGFATDHRLRNCIRSPSLFQFQLPIPPFGPFVGVGGQASSRQNGSFFGLLQRQDFVSLPAVDENDLVRVAEFTPFRCPVCLAAFPSAWLLEQHGILQHSISSRNSETGSPGEDKPFKCDQCGQSYRYKSAYLKHQEQNHKAKQPADKLFTCDICGMQFRYLKSFKKHRLNHALERLHEKFPKIGSNSLTEKCPRSASETSVDSVSGTSPLFGFADFKMSGETKESGRMTAPPTTYACGDRNCGTSFHEDLENGCLTTSKERSASVPLTNSNRLDPLGPSVHCYQLRARAPISGRTSLSKKRSGTIGISDNVDEQDETIDLTENNFRFRRESPFFNLLRMSSSGQQNRENRFSCPFCSKGVRSKENLKLHIRKHTGERPFVCLFCGRAFGGKSDLTRHLRIHTGERPYHCEMCGKCFARADYLSKHLSTHSHLQNSGTSLLPQSNR